MSCSQSASDLILSALALPIDDRLAVMDAIHVSLVDRAIDHGPAEPAETVQTAWRDEIALRISDIETGRVQTVPADEAERLIRSDAKPTV